MIKVKRFVNQLMTSNCYIVVDEEEKKCIVIDPGSEKSDREIDYIREYQLTLDYVIVTHEHSDHNWGVNALMDAFESVKLVCSEECSKQVNKLYKAYFLLYYDNPNYHYYMKDADIIINSDNDILNWKDRTIQFVNTPGHSFGSMCVYIDGFLFTGDTIMPYKAYFNGRDSNKSDWVCSVKKIVESFPQDTVIFPGHGEKILLQDWMEQYGSFLFQ